MTEPILEVRGLTRRFGALVVSDGIDLSLEPGEIHAVIGPNGAGKTTLIAQICGGLAPDAGTIHLKGRDVTALTVRARARMGLARTFQISALAMEDTVLQNAMLGALGAGGRPWRMWHAVLSDRGLRSVAEAALDRVGLTGKAAVRTGRACRIGERRQLEVAVALTLGPRLRVWTSDGGPGTDGGQKMTALARHAPARGADLWWNTTWTRSLRWPTGSACWQADADRSGRRMQSRRCRRAERPTWDEAILPLLTLRERHRQLRQQASAVRDPTDDRRGAGRGHDGP